MPKSLWALLIGITIFSSPFERAHAQSKPPVQANLAQLMKGTLYPEANVVFAAQDLNPAEVPHAKDPNMSTDLLTSSYGKWEGVENSALAIAEVANLLAVPGRKCSNGVDVPVNNPDWAKFVQELRDAGMAAYAAAQTKNQDKMIDISDVMTKACQGCHFRYRERKVADRCK
jgi:hypothetical protein